MMNLGILIIFNLFGLFTACYAQNQAFYINEINNILWINRSIENDGVVSYSRVFLEKNKLIYQQYFDEKCWSSQEAYLEDLTRIGFMPNFSGLFLYCNNEYMCVKSINVATEFVNSLSHLSSEKLPDIPKSISDQYIKPTFNKSLLINFQPDSRTAKLLQDLIIKLYSSSK